MRGFRNEAWVTGVTSELQVGNALVLCESLKRVLTSRKLVAIVSPEVTLKSRKILRQAFDFLFSVDNEEQKLVSEHCSPEQFSLLFSFTLQSFKKCVWVNPCMFAVTNCDEIFNLAEEKFVSTSKSGSVNSISNAAHFTCLPNMDLALCLLKPSHEIFNSILESIKLCQNEGQNFANFITTWFTNQAPDQGKSGFIPERYRHVVSASTEDEMVLGEVHHRDMFFVQLEKPTLRLLEQNDIVNYLLNHWKNIYKNSVQPLLECQPTIPSMPEKYTKEPIAIIGMSCRYPKSNTLEEFWNLLFTGADGTSLPPDFRWLPEQSIRNAEEFRNTNAGFLAVPVDEFDSKFFGISNKEAIFMDPQQRLLHELIWEGLEDAAIDPHSLHGVHGGVFIGSWVTDYRDILSHSGLSEFYRLYMGNSIGACAARMSYLLGLTGPSIATESGCSSAMVAVHMAYKSLVSGESNIALAAGVNLLLHPFDKDEIPMALSPDGRCKTFSSTADGFGRAEGCCVLVMKRLSDAVKDGDRVWGLLRGSAMTQEGISRSMGTPTVHCEALAMTQALQDADLSPEKVSYVEAHGTGTVVGDPLEVNAIARAYHTPKRRQPLWIGSVKTNVGHTEACSGITGLMKVVLAMQHEVIPPHINFAGLNPDIKLEAVPAIITLEPVQWKRTPDQPRYAGVSAFGIAGTDVHVIVEETPEELLIPKPNDSENAMERPLHIIKMSAKTEEALELMLEKYRDHVKVLPEEDSLADIAFTSNTGRASFRHRAVVIAKTKEEFLQKIEGKAIKGETGSENTAKVCFLFTGQGSQYPGMAENLYNTSPVFKLHFDRCETYLRKKYNVHIKDALWGNMSHEIGRTIYSQTSIFCVEYALLQLWISWGLRPDCVLGHSLGEFCAAVCCGILSVEDALKLVCERSLLIDQLPRGKMLVIKQNKQQVISLLQRFSKEDATKSLDIAAINSNEQTVVAGDSNLVLELSKFLEEKDVKCILLDASHAFHSEHMDPMLDAYREVAKTVKLRENNGNCEYVSGLRGTLVKPTSVDPEYWVQHTRNPVNFLDASKKVLELGCQIFIEIGPQPILSALTMMNCQNSSKLVFVPSLKKKEEDWTTLLHSLSRLYVTGIDINWQGFDRYYSRNKVRLPNYPFIRKKFWPDVHGVSGIKIHPLLGSSIPNASAFKLFECSVNLGSSLEYIKDHAIGENVIFPGAGYLEICLAAGVAATEGYLTSFTRPTRPIMVQNLSIGAPLCLLENSSVQVQTVVEMDSDKQTTLQIKISHRITSDITANKWLDHANCTFDPIPSPQEYQNLEDFPLDQIINSEDTTSPEVNVQEIYDRLSTVGLIFGPIFRSVEKLWRHNTSDILVKVKCPLSDSHLPEYVVHPVILDSMVQSIMMFLILQEKENEQSKLRKKLYVPIKIGRFLWLSSPHQQNYQDIFIHVRQTSAEHTTECSAVLLDSTGKHLAVMSNVEVIDTTVKAIESIIQQQLSPYPDLWEETWKKKLGPWEHRIDLQNISVPDHSPELLEKLKSISENPSTVLESIYHLLTEFSGLSMLRALYECGWEPKMGDTFQSNELFKQLSIQEEHRQYFGFILDTLEEEGMLVKLSEEENPKDTRVTNDEWQVKIVNHPKEELQQYLDSPSYLENLTSKLKSIQVFIKVGQNFGEILQGKQSALTILFPEDSKNNPSAAEFYAEYGRIFGFEELGNLGLEHRMKYFKSKNEDDKFILRILEVGAGTGAMTTFLLEVMESIGLEFEYTYTDISAGFFAGAEKKFEKYAKNMKFRKLNVEEDPISQGFVPEYFDYICASEVIHATRNVCESLENVRLLLRPHGKLDLIESTVANRYITFLVGLLPGYWRFQDLDLRPKHCTMKKETWMRVLQKTGYVVDESFSCIMDQNSMICVHRKPEEVEVLEKKVTDKQNTWLIFQTENDKQITEYLKGKLEGLNRRFVLVHPTDTEKSGDADNGTYKIRRDSEEDFKWLLGDVAPNGGDIVEGVLYCWAMDRQLTEQGQLLQPLFLLTKHLSNLLDNKQQKTLPRVIVLTEGVVPLEDNDLSHYHVSTLWGYCKSLRNEITEFNCRTIDITDGDVATDIRLSEVFSEIFSVEKEPQAAFHGRTKYIPKLVPYKPSAQEQSLKLPRGTDRFKLLHPETKAIADLQFGHLDHYILADDEIEVEVRCFGLNFRDVLNVLKPTDQFKQKEFDTVGFDFAGVVSRLGAKANMWRIGDKVFGVNFDGTALPSHVNVREGYVVAVPERLPLSQAATLQVVFSTAYHCLVEVANIKPTDKVLIHTGSGGVGLSAIDICRHSGVKLSNIITTAGSRRKRNFLRNLGIGHVFHSRNTSYADEILRVTEGRGVDVVLNSLTSPGFKEASLKACTKGAWFLEMSKISVWTNEEIKALRPDINYYVIDVDIGSITPEDWHRRLKGMNQFFLEKELPSPLPMVLFDATDIRQALVYLQKARQIGKVVCMMPEYVKENGQLKPKIPMFNEKSSYLITGGLGGIGFLVCQWMVEKGAKSLVLVGRNPPSDRVQREIAKLRSKGSQIEVFNMDIGVKEQCEELFNKKIPESSLPPLKGVMHCAGTLSDGLATNLNWEKMSAVFTSKIDGTLNLHEFTKHCNLEHFVLFSSTSALFGPPGQSNHAAACMFEDAFAYYRHSMGLPATTVNWGQWGEVGVAMDQDFPGIRPITNLQGLATLEHVMKSCRIQTCALNVDSVVLWSKLVPQLSTYLDERVWKTSAGSGGLNLKSDEFWQEYDSKANFEEKEEVIKHYARIILTSVLRLEEGDKLRDDVDLKEMGVDSLMFVEIKNALQALLGERVTINTSALRECNTINRISEALVKQIEGDEGELEAPSAEQVKQLLRKDCVLPENIRAGEDTPRECGIKEIRTVLLTGATGTLGVYVLRELLKVDQVQKIYCLLRPKKDQSLEQRFNKILETRGLLDSMPELGARVQLIAGNCALPQLGLESGVWQDLIENVDAIFNCFANVNHMEQYRERAAHIEDVRTVNIGGTKHILEFACEHRLKHVFQAASLVSVSTTDKTDGSIWEGWPELEDFDEVTTFTYPITKFVEDMLMKQAVLERGLPCKVFRLPYLAGDSKTGRFLVEQSHMMLRYIFVMKNGIMPSNPFPLLLLPVDTCAEMIVRLSFQENIPCDVYNITHNNPDIDQEFPEIAERFGFKVKIVEFSEFAQCVLEKGEKGEEGAGSYHPILKELYRMKEDEVMTPYNSAPAFRHWVVGENRETFFVSKKLQKYAPGFYNGLERSLNIVERDLAYARSKGWF